MRISVHINPQMYADRDAIEHYYTEVYSYQHEKGKKSSRKLCPQILSFIRRKYGAPLGDHCVHFNVKIFY